MTSIHDVAEAAGVSIATVSRALRGLPRVSPATRANVEQAAERLGYVPSPSAAGLVSGRHRAIAVVLPSLGRWFDVEVVAGADSVLRRAEHDMFLIDLAAGPGKRDRLFHNRLLRKRADAVLALGIDFSPEERRELNALQMPAIAVGGSVRGLRHIGVDDAHATRLVMDHLFALGHTRIAHVGGEDEFGVGVSVARVRRETWRALLAAHGLTDSTPLFASGGFLMPQAKVAARALLSAPERPTAIFAGSDEMAFGVLQAAVELGLSVPHDLSVVGIDDHAWSEAYGLTTVHQSPHEQGAAAARILLAEIAGIAAPAPPELIRRGELVVRRTTAGLGARPPGRER